MLIKGAQSDFFNFLKNFWRFWYHKKAHIFLITHGKFHSWKLFRLEGISEKVSSYGNHNKAYTVRYNQNGLTVSTEIWNLQLWSGDYSNEREN